MSHGDAMDQMETVSCDDVVGQMETGNETGLRENHMETENES